MDKSPNSDWRAGQKDVIQRMLHSVNEQKKYPHQSHVLQGMSGKDFNRLITFIESFDWEWSENNSPQLVNIFNNTINEMKSI